MAVFTDLSEDDCDRIATTYRLGRLTSVIGIADGDAETTFLFRAERGEFIVTLFETGAEPFDLERAFRTMETLVGAGVPCPSTLRTEAGAATITVSGKLVAVVGFVPGSRASEITPGKSHALGACAARIHRVLLRPVPGLPKGAVHGALNNFRLRHDDVLIAELAELLLHWTARPDGSLDGALACSLLAGYEDVRPLGALELHALPAFVMAAMATSLAEAGSLGDFEASAQRASVSARACIKEMRP